MRVLQIGLSRGYGGVESFAMTYFRGLKEKGILFDFVDLYGEGLAYSEEIKALGGRIYTLKNYKKHPVAAKRDLKRIIKENGYTCVHIHMLSAAGLLPVAACEEAGVTPVIHSHNTKTNGLVRRTLHAVNVAGLRKKKAVRLACGTEAGRWMHGGNEFTVIPNAVDISSFAFSQDGRKRCRDQWNIPEGKTVLGFVGRLEEQKNPMFLLEVLSSLKKKEDDRYILLLVGSGSMEGRMREEASRRGLTRDVIFAGNQTNVGQWLSAMDIFLLPSFFEGLAISGIEAQCSGLPCLFSDKVTREIAVTDLGTFLDISRGADPWVTAIAGCKADPERRWQYSQSVANTPYSIAHSSEVLREIYLGAEKRGTVSSGR